MFDDDQLAAMFTTMLTQVTLEEAVARATFTVLVPELPTGMRALQYRCGERLEVKDYQPVPAFVTMVYVGGGGRTLAIQQVSATERRSFGTPADESWHQVVIDGTPIKVRGAGERSEAELRLGFFLADGTPVGAHTQAQAYLERDDTFAYLQSQGMSTDELATIAASLRPASDEEVHT